MASNRATSAQQDGQPAAPGLPTDLVDRHELSRRTGIPVRRLKQWTLERRCPFYRITSHLTLYSLAEFGQWLASRKQEPVQFVPPHQ